MEHYVCKGDCKTVSETVGVCTAEDCARKGQDFATCKCEDGEHKSNESTGEQM